MEHQPDYLRVSQAERERAEREACETGGKIICFVSVECGKKILRMWQGLKKRYFQIHGVRMQSEKAWNSRRRWLLSALEDGLLVGYLIVYYVLEDGEIARIAVESDFRRNGVASRLLKELAFICADNGVNKLLLDVRESNESAKAFYKKKGFVLDGVRKNYYTNPTENAILMSLELL